MKKNLRKSKTNTKTKKLVTFPPEMSTIYSKDLNSKYLYDD